MRIENQRKLKTFTYTIIACPAESGDYCELPRKGGAGYPNTKYVMVNKKLDPKINQELR